ncbi:MULTISPECIES: hypothetical protein [unclassified Methylophaga]|jgi:carbon starvation protein CstA|uniref:Uncharacterized protein n=1 Tax=Pseudidiomarina aestuarii TaxID=624146 RepID=A0A2T4CXW7_9GAMM|nr:MULTISPECIES: hypothetical protein [unclassified Methylophaga]PTB86390.1 hypothetical protein C9940_02625 [Pseudidiomarina aestuarii]MAL49730.1 hypothetical protein [Methylophaga sp.]MAP26543.1 hypothetical protein [Methylophaga sp.]MBP23793.1 hypothetical protein [Methylophaga sp.]HBX61212.1 hypothetical protein [Methylophaga sp.]|tara:strand:- start:3049 stop:3360 length:312 start_codon:yes stop_codon:yes gene_type:complete
MDRFSTIGIILLLILAIVGGYMTGLFAGYLFDLGKRRLGKTLTVLLNLVFYVVPLWALLGIASEDGLLFFYLLLLVFYYLGIRDSKHPAVKDDKPDKNYEPYD